MTKYKRPTNRTTKIIGALPSIRSTISKLIKQAIEAEGLAESVDRILDVTEGSSGTQRVHGIKELPVGENDVYATIVQTYPPDAEFVYIFERNGNSLTYIGKHRI